MQDVINERYVVSSYGFLSIRHESGHETLEVFTPFELMGQLNLPPGSTAIVQGLTGGQRVERLYIRSRTGLERESGKRSPFTATIRFPNEPGVLSSFLKGADKAEVTLQAIRTFGYRAQEHAEVVFEGSIPQRDLHFVYRSQLSSLLEKALGDTEASITSQEILQFSSFEYADVTQTVYELDLPVLRGRYLKVRMTPEQDDRLGLAREQLHLIRLTLDINSMTLTVDLGFARLNHYVLTFAGTDLEKAPPVTSTILECLTGNVNVDAISAFEYVKFDPRARNVRAQQKPSGMIEMLCTSEKKLRDVQELEGRLNQALRKELRGQIDLDCRFQPFDSVVMSVKERLAGPEGGEVRRDVEGWVFRKLLNKGRYGFIGFLGEGSFGEVLQYLDFETGRLVAGKRIKSHTAETIELDVLMSESAEVSTAETHLISLVDYFFDDEVPVLVTECLDFTLDSRYNKPRRDTRKIAHAHPSTLREFLTMAIELCTALESLHQRKLVHWDVKPANIGGVLVDSGVSWRLIDYGIARHYGGSGGDVELTTTVRGTLPYMAPEVFLHEKIPVSDMFSLGVTLFEVLNGWKHPSRDLAGGRFVGEMVPVEVAEFLIQRTTGVVNPTKVADGYNGARWDISPEFTRGVEDETMARLKQVILEMMQMERSGRTPDADTARRSFEAVQGSL